MEGYKWEHETLYKILKNKNLKHSEIVFVINKVSNAIRRCGDLVCCDNFRFSINDENDKEYDKIRNQGCCGFHDEVIELYSGTKVKFGFNYGH